MFCIVKFKKYLNMWSNSRNLIKHSLFDKKKKQSYNILLSKRIDYRFCRTQQRGHIKIFYMRIESTI